MDFDKRLRKAEEAPLTWDPVKGGKRVWICFDDDKSFDLGADPTGTRFREIVDRMLTGRYYPRDAVEVDGRFRREGREIQAGDRLLQAAPLFGKFGRPMLYAATEIYVAERSEDRCELGYVTTKFHFARGIWSAELTRSDGRLGLRVKNTVCPGSLLFWLGLPYARYLQVRARRRSVEEFRKI